MFGRIFIKEWRDNRILLSITGLVLAALVVMGLAGRDKTSLAIAGILILVVLPLTALLLGSGGFGTEFKSDAWTYLFSRPIGKGRIWAYKYLSLLIFVGGAFLILSLAVGTLPGLKRVLADFYAPDFMGTVVIDGMGIFLALTISYSLSILSEKPLVIFPVAVLCGVGLLWLYVHSVGFFEARYAYWHRPIWIGLFVAASFILASVLTLTRVDFTRKVKKTAVFAAVLLVSLIISYAAILSIVSGGNPLAKPRLELWQTEKAGDNLLIRTYGDKLLAYNAKSDRIQRLPGNLADAAYFPGFSSAAGKLAFIKSGRSWAWASQDEVMVANLDGTAETPLARFYGKGSPLEGWEPDSNILISPSGRQVAFVALGPGRDRGRNAAHIFWVNADGTGLKDRPLEFFRQGTIDLLSWQDSEGSVVLRLSDKRIHSLTLKIIKLNLETGATRIFESTLPGASSLDWMSPATLSPGRRFMIVRDPGKLEAEARSMVLDLSTLEIKDACPGIPYWRMFWSAQEDRFAYVGYRDRTLWICSIKDGSRRDVLHFAQGVGADFDWLADGRMVISGGSRENVGYIDILSKDLSREKRLKIPDGIMGKRENDFSRIYGLNDRVLFANEISGVWRLDLKTEEWKRVY